MPETLDTSDVLDPNTMWGRVFDLSQKQLVHLDGFDLFVMANDYVGGSILSSREYESHVTAVVKRELGQHDVFLDLGANLGYFTFLASTIAASGKVISFEPNHQNLQLIYESMLANSTNNVTVFPYAVSDARALLKFFTVGSNGGIVTEHAKWPHYFYVQAVVLDEVLKDEPRIDFVKMDIEAHEPFALKGMEKIVKKHRPRIVTEFHPWAMRMSNVGDPYDYLRQIRQLDYSLSIITPDGNLMEVRELDDVLSYWKSLGNELMQLDLFARPLN